jgi:hypothetical protein
MLYMVLVLIALCRVILLTHSPFWQNAFQITALLLFIELIYIIKPRLKLEREKKGGHKNNYRKKQGIPSRNTSRYES